MIKTKGELNEYLRLELHGSNNYISRIRDFVIKNESYYLRKYIITLRKTEFYYNNIDNFFYRLLYYIFLFKLKRLYYITKIELYPNQVGKGLTLFHYTGDKQGAVKNAVIGEHVILRPGTVLGYQGDTMRESLAAPVVGDYVEFSWGVKVFGGIKIGRGAVLNANCVPMSNIPPYSIVAGNPAKVIGFTKTPGEVIEFEKSRYNPEDRLSLELLEKNYDKFFINRIKDIQKLTRI